MPKTTTVARANAARSGPSVCFPWGSTKYTYCLQKNQNGAPLKSATRGGSPLPSPACYTFGSYPNPGSSAGLPSLKMILSFNGLTTGTYFWSWNLSMQRNRGLTSRDSLISELRILLINVNPEVLRKYPLFDRLCSRSYSLFVYRITELSFSVQSHKSTHCST